MLDVYNYLFIVFPDYSMMARGSRRFAKCASTTVHVQVDIKLDISEFKPSVHVCVKLCVCMCGDSVTSRSPINTCMPDYISSC